MKTRPLVMTPNHNIHALLGALLCLAASVASAMPLKVFILAGQSNMDGQADVRTIDFLGEDKDPARAALLKTPDEQAMPNRATSNLGFHYFGEGRFFILLGKSMAESMLELMGKGKPQPPAK